MSNEQPPTQEQVMDDLKQKLDQMITTMKVSIESAHLEGPVKPLIKMAYTSIEMLIHQQLGLFDMQGDLLKLIDVQAKDINLLRGRIAALEQGRDSPPL